MGKIIQEKIAPKMAENPPAIDARGDAGCSGGSGALAPVSWPNRAVAVAELAGAGGVGGEVGVPPSGEVGKLRGAPVGSPDQGEVGGVGVWFWSSIDYEYNCQRWADTSAGEDMSGKCSWLCG